MVYIVFRAKHMVMCVLLYGDILSNFLYIKFFNTKELVVLKKYKIGAYGANYFDLFYYKERLD